MKISKNIPHQGRVCVCVCVHSVAQSLSQVQLFLTLWTVARQAPLSMGILQARILEWVAMPFSKGSSQPRDQTQVSCTGRYNGSELHCSGPDSEWRWEEATNLTSLVSTPSSKKEEEWGEAIVSPSRQWHPTPVLLPGKSHGRRSLVGCSPWGR